MEKDYFDSALALHKRNKQHYFETSWKFIDLVSTYQPSRLPSLRKATLDVLRHTQLPKTDASKKHIQALLMNLVACVETSSVVALAYPSTETGLLEIAPEDNPIRITSTILKTVQAFERVGYVIKIGGKLHTKKAYSRLLPTFKLYKDIIQLHNLQRIKANISKKSHFIQVHLKDASTFEKKERIPLNQFNLPTDRVIIKNTKSFLHQYNHMLARTHVTLSDGSPPPARMWVFRQFCRGSLNHGGRFYGGFWQQIGKEERKKILINGEPTVEKDFQALQINIAYALQGLEPCRTDPFLLKGYNRHLVKKCIYVALNCKTGGGQAILRAVKADPRLCMHYTDLLNGGYAKLKSEFLLKHPAIEAYLHSDKGTILQRWDSDIAMSVLQQFMNLPKALSFLSAYNTLPILCIHDSFICPAPFESELQQCMIGGFERVLKTKTAPPIK